MSERDHAAASAGLALEHPAAPAHPRVLLNVSPSELEAISGDVSFYRDLAAAAGGSVDHRFVEHTPAGLRRPLGALARVGRVPAPRAVRARAFRLSRYRALLRADFRDADVVLSHLTYPWFLGRGARPPVVWSSQGISPPAYYDAIGSFRFAEVVRMYEEFGRRAARVQVWTRSCAELMMRHCTFKTPVEVVPPVVRVPRGVVPAARSAKVHLLFIGRHPARKGLFELLVAFRRLAQAHRDVRLDVVSVLPARARDMLIAAGDVAYHETVDEATKWRLLARADVLVLPTHAETFGYVLCEAMAFGCALVASDYAPLNEMVEDGVNGAVVEPGNAGRLYGALDRIVSSPALLAEMQHRARQKYQANYCAAAVLPRYLDMIGRTARAA